ncbi:MAG TPA: hypothetical protein VMV95_00210 [Bacillota bacterium]|nr:hypothetical protein [Bacillota bacterium]
MAYYEPSYENIPEEYATPPKENYQTQEYRISLVKELSPQEHLREQIAWLEGKLWDDKEKAFVRVEGMTPFMNQEGRDMYFQFATSVLSPIVTMSNYRADDKIIHALIGMVIKDASIHFHLHYKDYGITRKTKIKVLIDKLLILGLSAMYKALGAGDRKAATSNISESISNITKSSTPEQTPLRKPGMFGGLWRR